MTPLYATPQWIVVLLVPLAHGKTDKLPIDWRTGAVTGKGLGAHDPAIWTTHAQALATATAWGSQFTIGFVITAADPFWCLDIDGALDVTTGHWSPLSQQLCAALPGTCVEISQSGRGLHIWGQGAVPDHSAKNEALHIELYSKLRFIAIGTQPHGDMSLPCPSIAAVAAAYFPPRVGSGIAIPDDGPRADWRGPEDDEDLLRRAMQSRSLGAVFGDARATFADLWHADAAVLSRAYPADASGSGQWNGSRADAALAQMLAFWTGCDQARIDRLMRQSSLLREKWDDREDYLPTTIAVACKQQVDVLQDKPTELPAGPVSAPAAPAVPLPPGVAPPAPAAPGPGMRAVVGETFLPPARQVELFANCTYLADQHRVLVPGGKAYRPEQFNAMFGGYTFAVDARNERTVRKAFEAFTESQVLRPPVAEGTCFRPDLPFGAMVESEGRKRANVYWPANVRRVAGDPTPFLQHLERLLPNKQDRDYFLYYMAGMVQFPGHKFQFFPLLVGVEGNGKSFFSSCVSKAIGQRYSHWPAANKLGKDFNEWLFGKLAYFIEDLKIGDSAELWEKLKPMITGENLEIEGKGVDQRTDEVCGNFIANSNHKNAIRATANDRRVMHLFCAQQEVADLARDGITVPYVGGLYGWAKHQDGFAIVAEYLHTVAIPPEYGLPWLMGRAPKTSGSAEAMVHSLGRIEQEIMESVEQDVPGFRGGWISSIAVERLMEKLGRAGSVPHGQRRQMMRSLGYDWHPGLPDGRVHNIVAPDGGKPKLFVQGMHPSLALTVPGDIARAYTAAQGVGV